MTTSRSPTRSVHALPRRVSATASGRVIGSGLHSPRSTGGRAGSAPDGCARLGSSVLTDSAEYTPASGHDGVGSRRSSRPQLARLPCSPCTATRAKLPTTATTACRRGTGTRTDGRDRARIRRRRHRSASSARAGSGWRWARARPRRLAGRRGGQPRPGSPRGVPGGRSRSSRLRRAGGRPRRGLAHLPDRARRRHRGASRRPAPVQRPGAGAHQRRSGLDHPRAGPGGGHRDGQLPPPGRLRRPGSPLSGPARGDHRPRGRRPAGPPARGAGRGDRSPAGPPAGRGQGGLPRGRGARRGRLRGAARRHRRARSRRRPRRGGRAGHLCAAHPPEPRQRRALGIAAALTGPSCAATSAPSARTCWRCASLRPAPSTCTWRLPGARSHSPPDVARWRRPAPARWSTCSIAGARPDRSRPRGNGVANRYHEDHAEQRRRHPPRPPPGAFRDRVGTPSEPPLRPDQAVARPSRAGRPSPRQPGARSLGLGAGRAVPYAVERRPLAHVVRGERMAWTRPGSPARRHGVNPTAAWRG